MSAGVAASAALGAQPVCVAAMLALLAGIIGTGCSPEATGASRRMPLTGVVIGREASPPRLVVSHDAVDGFMPAMTMAFEVRGEAPPLGEGDRIASTLVVSDGHSWLEAVTLTSGRAARPAPLAPRTRAQPGAIVPDFPLVDQAGRRITVRGLGERVLVMTFIYTRCPLPDLCPLMVRHLERVRQRANDEGFGGRVALVGVSLDPAFDSPDVLRRYGESMLARSRPFDQWTLATGSAPQIEDISGYFGLATQTGGGVVTHTLATAVIGHDGRVMRIFASNAWRPDDLFDVVRRSAERIRAQ